MMHGPVYIRCFNFTIKNVKYSKIFLILCLILNKIFYQFTFPKLLILSLLMYQFETEIHINNITR